MTEGGVGRVHFQFMLIQVKSTNCGPDGANVKSSVKCLYAFILRKCLSENKISSKSQRSFPEIWQEVPCGCIELLACSTAIWLYLLIYLHSMCDLLFQCEHLLISSFPYIPN